MSMLIVLIVLLLKMFYLQFFFLVLDECKSLHAPQASVKKKAKKTWVFACK